MKTKIKTFLSYLEEETNIEINSTSIAPLKYTDSKGRRIRQDTILFGDPICLLNITSSIGKCEKKIIDLKILYGNERALYEANIMQKKIESVIPSIPVTVSFILEEKPILP